MSKEQKQMDELYDESKEQYEYYKNTFTRLIEELENKRAIYNAEINLINGECLLMRDQIKDLYKFLIEIGNLNYKISPFDFQKEKPAPSIEYQLISPLEKGRIKESFSLLNLNIQGIKNTMENKDTIEAFSYEKEQKLDEYSQQQRKIKEDINFFCDAHEIAIIFRNIVVMVRDAIKDMIIPEMEFIQSFLYADAIKDLVLDERTTEDITVVPVGIEEYEGTKQDIHFQFVKNAFDFYEISTAFFRKTVLTDIIEDKIVTDEERRNFENDIDAIKNSIKSLEGKKVLK